MLVLLSAIVCRGQNPIVQTKFTADPTPLVYYDNVFLYTGHDEDEAKNFKMADWLLYTSTDMVNWTDRGAVALLQNFSRAPKKNGALSPQVIERNGHSYLANASTGCPEGIGYAMSDKPTGPWIYKGMIMDRNPLSSGNYPGIIDYQGNSYVLGFNYTLNYALTKVHNERRSVCLEKIMLLCIPLTRPIVYL